MKCQNNIQELHLELEKANNEKLLLQDKNENTKNQMLEFETKYKDEKIQREKSQGFFKKESIIFINLQIKIDENQISKKEISDVKEANFFLEEKIKNHKEKERLYEEVKEKFKEVCEENESLQNNVNNLQNEINKKGQLEKEWDSLLSNIKIKIKLMQQENDG